MMYLVVLSLCVASCLAKPGIGYPYPAYTPFSSSYLPHQSLLTPYALSGAYPWGGPSYYGAAPLHYAAPLVAHEPIKSQYHTQDGYGQASYGHSEAFQSHHATQDAHGNKIGSYSYVKPDGHIHRTDYVADAAGYRAASNDLPISPAAPLHALHKRSIYPQAIPVVTASGHLADTPEVAAAKAAHFAEHAKQGNYLSSYVAPYSHAAYAAPYSVAPTYYTPNTYYNHYSAPLVTPSGYLADTPEVAAAKAAHFTEKAKVSAAHYNAIPVAHHGHHGHQVYPYVPSTGHVADTPEVSAAKAAHFAEHAAAVARNAAAEPVDHSGYSGYTGYSGYSKYSQFPGTYAAAPIVTASGHLADTPEVAQAKAAHLAEFAAIASRQKRSILYGQTPASTYPLTPALPYSAAPLTISHAPLAYPYSYPATYPLLKPITHSTILHGPHAVSYQVSH